MRTELITACYRYSMHIGSNMRTKPSISIYLIGKRLGHWIIDVKRLILNIKKVMLFLNTLANNSGNICYFHSTFNNYNILYKSCILKLVTNSFQSIILQPWLYGSITNYYSCFYEFLKSILGIWDTTRTFSDIAYNIPLWEIRNVVTNGKISLIERNTSGEINSRTKPLFFINQLCNNKLHVILKQQLKFKFKILLLKTMYWMVEKETDNLFINKIELINSYTNKFNKRVTSYWRLLIYYKYFQSIYKLPDAFFFISPDNNIKPIREVASTNELITIGLVDTDGDETLLNYPICCNDDSSLIVCFFITLFSEIFMASKINIYTSLIDTNFINV